MVETDIDQLRQFGQRVQVQKHKRSKAVSQRTITPNWNQIIQKLDISFKNGISYSTKIKNNVLEKIVSSWKNIKHRNHRKKTMFCFNSTNRHKEDPKRVIVEYQRQVGNTSIIIRQRKTINSMNKSNESITIPQSNPMAYYFNRIDSNEQEVKTMFSPRSSIWDLRYPNNRSVFRKLKAFFGFID